MSHSYPSDISREQFARILPTLEAARRRTKPRTVDLYDVFCGVLYLLKSGCQWRMLPADFPDWRTGYKYFRQWSERPGPEQESILEQVLKKPVGTARRSNGRKEQTSFCIVDAQSVRNTDSAEHKGYDAGKKVSGIKRHIAVDTQGLPHAIHVTTANVTGRAGALAMFDQRQADLSRVQNVLVDGGYTGKPFAAAVQSLLGASVEVVKRNELHTFVVLPAFSPREDGGMGGGAILCLAGEVPPALEELREKAEYQSANGGSCLRDANPEEIVNRLLGMG